MNGTDRDGTALRQGKFHGMGSSARDILSERAVSL